MKFLPIGFNAVEKPLPITAKNKTHHHVIGASDSGKSKFLEQMLRANLQARQGFCLVDPHGTLYHNILKYCAYKVYRGDIILLNLSEPEQIVGFNFFTKEKTGKTSVQVDNLIQATLHAWDAKNTDHTPTLGRTLKVIYTSMLDAGLTLPEVAKIIDFAEAKFIKDDLAAKIENDLIRREWLELASLNRIADFRGEILSTKNRLFPFLTSETLLQFIGIKDQTIDLLEAMEKQKVILVNLGLSPDLSREEARLFGSLLVNQFFQAALRRRPDALGRDPKPYYLYLDEFQNFVSIDLCNMLDEVRKFGLFLTLSHQRFGQLNEDTVDAILTNCRTKTVFGGLPVKSARIMAEELFIGKIDPLKIKVAIYQTKHWYQYTRDKVYSRARSYGEGEGETEGRGSSRGSGEQNSTGSGDSNSAGNSFEMQGIGGQIMLPPTVGGMYTGAMWLSDGTASSQMQTTGHSNMESTSEFSGRSKNRFWSESDSVADIPTLLPVPYQELSSIQTYSTEEQLVELTQALKLNQQRHCFIQFPNEETQPMLVPFVKSHYISRENLNWYVNRVMKELGALTEEEANELIFQARPDLLQFKDQPKALNPATGETAQQTSIKDKTKKNKLNAFTHIPTEDDDPFGRE